MSVIVFALFKTIEILQESNVSFMFLLVFGFFWDVECSILENIWMFKMGCVKLFTSYSRCLLLYFDILTFKRNSRIQEFLEKRFTFFSPLFYASENVGVVLNEFIAFSTPSFTWWYVYSTAIERQQCTNIQHCEFGYLTLSA